MQLKIENKIIYYKILQKYRNFCIENQISYPKSNLKIYHKSYFMSKFGTNFCAKANRICYL